MSLGVTIGKFYPFHLGHDHLIREAKARVDRLVVVVGFASGQALPGELRVGWIRALHPDVEVLLAGEDIAEAPLPWAERMLALLGGRRPDLAFTSEGYGPAWAEAMGARHVAIDPERRRFPISGTQLRADLGAHWALLAPPARAYFARRVCVLGVESSGTTTLARALARRYRTAWVPEYGRWYWEGRRYAVGAERWDSAEFVRIAEGQRRWEADLAPLANRLLILDTDALATSVWQWRYTGAVTAEVEALAAEAHADLTLLTAPDIPFVQDGTREGEGVRAAMHGRFREALAARGRPCLTLTGDHRSRLRAASEAIAPLLRFDPIPEP
jgi:NadR type nicotinamide-nucleotide adenylyltransferase